MFNSTSSSFKKDESGLYTSDTFFANACNQVFQIAKDAKKNKTGFTNAIERLLDLEKFTRHADQPEFNAKVLIEIIDLCFDLNRWKELNEYLIILTNRRLVIKESIASMIKHCLLLAESISDKDFHLELIKTLYNITEGKNYLEIERAKFAKILANNMEQENNINEAIKILEDLKCEIISNMDNREKIKLQLQLIRLLIVKEDFIKAQILSQKISTKFLEQPEQEDLKLNFYNLKITLDRKKNFLTTSKHYLAILNCYSDGDPMKLKMIGNAILYCILAPYDSEQKDAMENLSINKLLEKIPQFKDLLSFFLSNEIIDIDSFLKKFQKHISKYDIFSEKTEIGKNNCLEINNRLLEHNTMIIAMYYSRIYLNRMSEILCATQEKCEEFISKLATNGCISAKIDRLTGIVHFVKLKQSSEILNDWSFDMRNTMKKINKAYQEVNKVQCCANANKHVVFDD